MNSVSNSRKRWEVILNIWKKQEGACPLCRRQINIALEYPDPLAPSIDHIIPVAIGEDKGPTNWQITHTGCNHAKADTIIQEPICPDKETITAKEIRELTNCINQKLVVGTSKAEIYAKQVKELSLLYPNYIRTKETYNVDDNISTNKLTKDKLTQGTKYDAGKPRWDLLPTKAVKEVVKVLTFGANKYDAWNWYKGINYSRLYASSQRHLTAFWEREDNDPETGISHLAHLSCCVLFLLTFQVLGTFKEFDDRPPV